MTTSPSIDWSAIDTVLLDMDGTLLDLRFDNYFWQEYLPECYASAHGMSVAQSYAYLVQRFAQERGTLNWYCLDYWTAELGVNIFQLKQSVRDRIAVRPTAKEFLQWLRAQGKRSVLLTNAHPDSMQLKMAQTGIDILLDKLHSTHEFGYPKEHAECWQCLHAVEPFNPVRTLFIDDTELLLRVSRDFGIAWQLGIFHPDSGGDRTSFHEFPAVHWFDEIMG